MTRTLLVTAFLTLPTWAAAQHACPSERPAQTCAEGASWNSDTGACEKILSS